MTLSEARSAAAHILSRYQPAHLERLRMLLSGPRQHADIDSEMGCQFTTTGAVYQRALVHSYGGGLSPVMSALTPLGRACAELITDVRLAPRLEEQS